MNILDRSIAPDIHKNNSFHLQKPTDIRLSNGIHLYLFENSDLDLIHFSIRVRAGSLFEPIKLIAGTAYNLLIESSSDKSGGETEEFLDFYGSSFNASVALEYVTLNFIIPKRNCLTVLPFIFDFITNPVYKEDSLLHYKQRKSNELEYNLLKPGFCADQLMYHTLLNPDISIGKMLCRDDIENLTISQIEAYHQSSFCVENINLFVAGNIEKEEIDLLLRLCGQISSGDPFRLPQIAPDLPPKKMIVEKRENLSQSAIRIGRRLFAYEDSDRRDFSILNTILGGYFGSRLMKNLREKRGYTYGVFSTVSYFGDSSVFYVDADVNIDKTEDAIAQCRMEFERLRSEHMEEEELAIVKSYLQGSLLRRLDGAIDYMRSYMIWKSAGLDEKEQGQIMQSIEKITPDRIMELSRQYLNPDDFSIIVAGDLENYTKK